MVKNWFLTTGSLEQDTTNLMGRNGLTLEHKPLLPQDQVSRKLTSNFQEADSAQVDRTSSLHQEGQESTEVIMRAADWTKQTTAPAQGTIHLFWTVVIILTIVLLIFCFVSLVAYFYWRRLQALQRGFATGCPRIEEAKVTSISGNSASRACYPTKTANDYLPSSLTNLPILPSLMTNKDSKPTKKLSKSLDNTSKKARNSKKRTSSAKHSSLGNRNTNSSSRKKSRRGKSKITRSKQKSSRRWAERQLELSLIGTNKYKQMQ